MSITYCTNEAAIKTVKMFESDYKDVLDTISEEDVTRYCKEATAYIRTVLYTQFNISDIEISIPEVVQYVTAMKAGILIADRNGLLDIDINSKIAANIEHGCSLWIKQFRGGLLLNDSGQPISVKDARMPSLSSHGLIEKVDDIFADDPSNLEYNESIGL